MLTTQQKIQIIAKMDGWIYDYSRECFQKGQHWCVDLTKINYLTSHDAILPVIVKWCEAEDSTTRWATFEVEMAFSLHGNIFHIIRIADQFKATPEQLSNALIKAMEKWED